MDWLKKLLGYTQQSTSPSFNIATPNFYNNASAQQPIGPGLGYNNDYWNPTTGQIQNTPVVTPTPVPTPSGGSNNSSSYLDNIRQRTEEEEKRRRDEADATRNRSIAQGQNIFDQGNEILNQRRTTFDELFNNTDKNILEGYEQNRGELRESATGANQRQANDLRAMGMNGSAVINTKGAQQQANLAALGKTQRARDAQKEANVANRNEQNMWADTTFNSLMNNLQGVKDQAEGNYTNYINNAMTNTANSQNNIDSILASLNASKDTASSYVPTAANINTDDGTSTVPNVLTATEGTPVKNQNVSMINNPYLDEMLTYMGRRKPYNPYQQYLS
jgi:hypothetical protein